MRRNSKIFLLFLLCLVVFFILLNILEEEDFKVDKMPAIVFLKKIYYYDYTNKQEDNDYEMLVFCDDKGNYYTSKNAYVCSLSIEELVKEYEQGNLNDKIKLFSSCDVDELKLNYKKLIKVAKNKKFKLVYPHEQIKEVLSKETIKEFYGIYTTSKGIKYLELQKENGYGGYYTKMKYMTGIKELLKRKKLIKVIVF